MLLFEDAVLDPFQRAVELVEDAHAMLQAHQPDLVEVALHVAAARQAARDVAEKEKSIALRHHVLDLLQHVHRRDVH